MATESCPEGIRRAAYLREWRAKNPDKVREYNARRREAMAAWRRANRERLREYSARHNLKRVESRRTRRSGPKPSIAPACAFCAYGPCAGKCEGS